MRRLPLIVAAATVAAWLFAACAPEQKRYVPNVGAGDVTPTMSTSDVSTLISDSGYTRYHLTAPLWQMFEDADEPFWRFPGGLELEQYDLQLQPTANVVCDSAIYFSRKRLWRLDGNVVMVNTQADSFLTQQLFWNQNDRKIYTDSFIHIVRTDRIIEGYGMVSDQNMLYYTVTNPTAILPANSLPGRRADSTRTDTARRAAPAPKAAPKPAPKPEPERATAVGAAKAVDMQLQNDNTPGPAAKPVRKTLTRSKSQIK